MRMTLREGVSVGVWLFFEGFPWMEAWVASDGVFGYPATDPCIAVLSCAT